MLGTGLQPDAGGPVVSLNARGNVYTISTDRFIDRYYALRPERPKPLTYYGSKRNLEDWAAE